MLFDFNFTSTESVKNDPFSAECKSSGHKTSKRSEKFTSDWKDLRPLSVIRNWYKHQRHQHCANTSRSNRHMKNGVNRAERGIFWVFLAQEIRTCFKHTPAWFSQVSIEGVEFETVSSAKVLGVVISSDLKYYAHIDSITTKAAKRLYLLRHLIM